MTECQHTFDVIKQLLTAVPLLAYLDLSKPMTLYTDASDTWIGACLTQPCPRQDGLIAEVIKEIPIYFLFHKLSPTQQGWPITENKVAYASVRALQKLNYLDRAEFVIKTDHITAFVWGWLDK